MKNALSMSFTHYQALRLSYTSPNYRYIASHLLSRCYNHNDINNTSSYR